MTEFCCNRLQHSASLPSTVISKSVATITVMELASALSAQPLQLPHLTLQLHLMLQQSHRCNFIYALHYNTDVRCNSHVATSSFRILFIHTNYTDVCCNNYEAFLTGCCNIYLNYYYYYFPSCCNIYIYYLYYIIICRFVPKKAISIKKQKQKYQLWRRRCRCWRLQHSSHCWHWDHSW